MLGTAGVIFPYGNHSELPLFDPGIAVFDGGDIEHGGGGVGGPEQSGRESRRRRR
jgi:hypothetical protein